jgi:hypothetical protein
MPISLRVLAFQNFKLIAIYEYYRILSKKFEIIAEMAKLVDAQASGACGGNTVPVRIRLSAPRRRSFGAMAGGASLRSHRAALGCFFVKVIRCLMFFWVLLF